MSAVIQSADIPLQMKAAVLSSPGLPLRFEELPLPQVLCDEVLIKVQVCGLTKDDVSMVDGTWRGMVTPCAVVGHEVIGTVAALGSESTKRFSIGERVGLCWLARSCMDDDCAACSEARPTMCSQSRHTGYHVDGGLAEYVKCAFHHVTRIPEELSSEDAAPLLGMGSWVWKALHHCNAITSPKKQILIMGAASNAGHLAIQYCQARGIEVFAVDDMTKPANRALMEMTKPAHVIDSKSANGPVEEIFNLTGRRGVDSVLIVNYDLLVCSRIIREQRRVDVNAKSQYYSVGIFAPVPCTPDASEDALQEAVRSNVRPRVAVRAFADVNDVVNDLRNKTVEVHQVVDLRKI